MRVTIGIPTYNGAPRLEWLLRSIALRTEGFDHDMGHDLQIVVVDDGSPKVAETRAIVEAAKRDLPVALVEHGRNRGISAGWNTASRATNADYVVLVNDDVVMSGTGGEWLSSLLVPLSTSPKVGVVGQSWHAFLPEDVDDLLRSPDSDTGVTPRDPLSKRQEADRRTKYEDTNPGRVMAPTGQLFAFRRRDFDEIGGFDETYESFYEESDFGTSMAKADRIGVQINWPFCWHLWSATFSQNPELRAGQRLAASKAHYRQKWAVPTGVAEFDYTNPLFLGAVGDVELQFLRRGGVVERGVLRRDGSYVQS